MSAEARANDLQELLTQARSQRDAARRAFDKLDAAINHHRRDQAGGLYGTDVDERLWAARDKIVAQLAQGTI